MAALISFVLLESVLHLLSCRSISISDLLLLLEALVGFHHFYILHKAHTSNLKKSGAL